MEQYLVENTDQLAGIGKILMEKFPDTRIFVFRGEMGAGKTTFIQAITRLLGVRDTVNSPTFSIVNEYIRANGESIYHFDFYRIEKISEIYDLGYEDYFFSGAYCFIEWPEKASELLPQNSVYIQIDWGVNDNSRVIRF
ncbi:MAG: tRNA (adenosine(37)-N6)-threonylcarbamoyltransferase complex ATPase subunit type 1 TsaE [Bacteroidales bacterium]|nr:tRNA (adenosine(37)-N6)-threonylcarbamoyltransferase complex ATPase subunit type 1 TsaE [Bacteroidales bacterium]